METTINKGKRVNKWVNVRVIQQHYGYKWEDVSEYNITEVGYKELLKHDLKEYRLMGYATRVISRRILNV